jgi:hypothetical protein
MRMNKNLDYPESGIAGEISLISLSLSVTPGKSRWKKLQKMPRIH